MVDPSGMKGQQPGPPPPQQPGGWGPQGNYPQQQQLSSGSVSPAHYNSGAQYPQRYPSPQPPPQQGGPTPPPRSNSRGYPHQQVCVIIGCLVKCL